MRTRTRTRRARGGFTLVELVVVMLIVTIMAGVAVPVAARAIDREAKKATLAELRGIDQAVRQYFLDTGGLPAGAGALLVDDGATGWAGPYLSGAVQVAGAGTGDFDMDAWEVPYALTVAGDVWTLRSAGPDRAQGTSDDIVLAVDVTTERRDLTAERLQVINLAIRLYNEDWLSPPAPAVPDPLSASWPTAFGQLVTRGYLPNASAYRTDAWGADFVPVGGSSPVVAVGSPNTGP